MGLSFDPASGRCLPTAPSRNHYNPSLSTAEAIGIGFVAGSIVTGIIIALILFFIKRRKAKKNVSEVDKVEELELQGPQTGRVVSVENEFPL